MSRKASSRVSFTPTLPENPTSSEIPATMAARNRAGFKIPASFCNLPPRRSNGFFRLRVFRSLKEKVGRALCWVPKKPEKVQAIKRRVPAWSTPDSHHREAIDDCIEFINSKAYLERCVSVPERSR
ncbi:hypothetical protein AMTRI_Chr08g202250 [Amborella trichopoda]|uniref:Uncharacterized protein n=1 Tax=Amborella trichopoda TaxID=13333 RepID=W1PIC0_AMBTC|nr:hypothetical protein AMTR_s00029p00223260 [Amborella trichopoda]